MTEPPNESLKDWLKALAIGFVCAVIGMGVVLAVLKAITVALEAF